MSDDITTGDLVSTSRDVTIWSYWDGSNHLRDEVATQLSNDPALVVACSFSKKNKLLTILVVSSCAVGWINVPFSQPKSL